jgi:hypothetical protein
MRAGAHKYSDISGLVLKPDPLLDRIIIFCIAFLYDCFKCVFAGRGSLLLYTYSPLQTFRFTRCNPN